MATQLTDEQFVANLYGNKSDEQFVKELYGTTSTAPTPTYKAIPSTNPDLSKGVNFNNTLAAQVKEKPKTTMTDAGVKKYIGPMPKKEPGIVDTAKDIGKGIIRGPFENLKNTAVNLSKYLGIEGTPQELAPFSTDVLEMIGKPSTDAGKIAETISQVGTAVLTTRNIPGATTFTGSMATGAISDFVIWDSNDGRLADLLSEAGVQNELVKYLKHDPKDSAMEDNFKNVVEGALSNVVAEGVIRTTIAGYKAAKASLWASRTPEEVAVAIDGAAVKPIVPKAKKVVTPKTQVADMPIAKTPDTMVAKTPDVTGIKPPQTAFNYDKLGVGQQERNIIESITSNKDFEEYFKTGVKPLSVTEEEGKMLAATIGDDYLDFAKQLVQDTQDMDVKLVAMKKIMADKVTTISERLAVSDGTDKEALLKNLLDVQDIYTLVGGAKSVQVAGARTTSAGRIGINVADMMAKIDEARAVAPELLDRELDKFIDDVTATKMHKILQDLVDVESEVTLKKAVSMLDSNDGVLTKLANVLVESRTAGILSSPVTLGVNLVGNGSVVALRTIEYYMAGIIGKLSGSLDRFTMEELNAMSTGMLSSTKGTFRGLWNAVKGLKGGAKNFEDVLEESYLDSFKKYDTGSYRAISQDYLLGGTAEAGVIKQGLGGLLDAAGAVIRLPYHALGVTDDMFKRSIYNGQISYIGTREANKLGLTGNARNKFIGEFLASHQALFMNPKTELTPEMKDLVAKYIQDNNGKYHLEALERAREYTFQEEIRAGDADSKINKTLHWIDKARTASPYGQFIVPFFITPVNILKWVGRRTPGVHLLSQRMTSDILAGGRRKALAQAKLTMGVSLYTMGGLLAYNNMITGTAPEKEREAWKTAGIPEHSVKIGDKWVQYNRLDPIGMFLGIMADINQFHQDMVRRGYDNMEGYYDHMNEVAGATITSFTNNVMSKTWLKSVDDLLNAIDNKDATYLSAMASSLAPYTGAARWYNDVEYQKEARDIFEQFKKAYAPDELRDALDIFGKPIKVDTIYGVKQSSVSNSVVRKEIMRLKLGVEKFSNKIIMGGTQVELEPVDHWKLQSYINNMKINYKDGKSYILEDLLNKVVTSPEYQQAPDGIDFTIEGTKKSFIHSSISNAREAARAKLLKDNPAILKKYMDKRTENINTLGNKRRGLYENWLTPTSDTQQQQLLDVGKIK